VFVNRKNKYVCELTEANLVELYQSSKSNVGEHIKHIYEEGELDENATCRKFRQVASVHLNIKSYFQT